METSPTLHRQFSWSRHYYPGGSPAPFKKFTRSQSVVEMPTFTEKPEKGAAEQLSRTSSRSSLNPIPEYAAIEMWTEINEVC